MKKLLLTFTLIIAAFNVFCQSETYPYGPLPYRKLQETIGEKYLVTPMHADTIDFSDLVREDHPNIRLYNKDIANKVLTLQSIRGKKGFFTDEQGNRYTTGVNLVENHFYFLLLLTDAEKMRNLFLNKKLWINADDFKLWSSNHTPIPVKRFQPVTIIDITPSDNSTWPVSFTMKTSTGQTGTCEMVVSGTNSDVEDSLYPSVYQLHIFNDVFFAKDPRLTYHLSPATWAAVKAKKIYLGMPGDALLLVKGMPDKVNRTTTARSISEQWVYGNDYYYFRNDKLTTIQD